MKSRDYQEIVVAFRNGDEKAFASIYELYYGPLYYFSLRIIDSSGETQEIVADTFLKLWNLRENFESIQNIKSFLYITARNASINALKQKKDYARRNQEMGYLLVMENVAGPSQHDEIRSEVLTEILKEIENLPLQCRKIFKSSFVSGLKNSEIAEQFGLTVQTVKNQKTRAIKLLRVALGKRELQWAIFILQLLSV